MGVCLDYRACQDSVGSVTLELGLCPWKDRKWSPKCPKLAV